MIWLEVLLGVAAVVTVYRCSYGAIRGYRAKERLFCILVSWLLLSGLTTAAYGVITFRDSDTAVVVSGTSITVGRPGLTQPGDIMVAILGFRAVHGIGCADVLIPFGNPSWNLIGCTADGSTNATLYAYWREATGAEPSSYTWSHVLGLTSMVGGIAAYDDVDPISPIHVSVFAAGSNPGGETCTAPSLTTTVSNAMVLEACYVRSFGGITGISSPGPPWTGRWAFPTTGLLHGQEMSERLLIVPGSSGAAVSVFTGAAGISGFGAAQIALAPAPPPPTPTRLPTYTPRAYQVGQEFQVNSYTANSQAGPQIAMDPVSRDFVIVWSSIGQDGSPGYGVFGQRYSSSGSPIGTEFQVNTYTVGSQGAAGIAMQPGGEFVVAWTQESSFFAFDGDVIARRGSMVGGMLGSEFVVNTYTTHNQSVPQVAALDNGGFVVTWESGGPVIFSQDGWGNGVFARRLSSSGSPIGTEFQVNSFTEYSQWRSSVAPQPGGGFVVVWQSENQTGPTGMHDVFGQRFDSSGAKIGADFQVNTATVDAHQFYPHVDTDASGNFVVVWFTADQVNDQRIVQGQRFSSSGAKIGTEFQLSSGTEDVRAVPRVCVEDDGSMSAMWMVYNMTPPVDGDTFGIDLGQRARRYLSNGSPVTGDFSMNSFREGAQQGIFSGIACDEGRVIGTWMSERQDGDDGNLALVVTTLVDAPIAEGGVYASMFQFGTPTASPTRTPTVSPTWTPDLTPRRLAAESGDIWQIVRRSHLSGPTGWVPAVHGHKTLQMEDFIGGMSADVMCKVANVPTGAPILLGTVTGTGSLEFDENCGAIWLEAVCSPCQFSAYLGSD